MTALRRLWAVILTPSRGTPYEWACIFLAHAVLGAALGDALHAEGAAARLLIGAGYWLVKERGDLRRGGGLLDGIADALAVAVGPFLAVRGVAAMVLATACLGAWIREQRHGSDMGA